jgi:hypothetical protein
VTYSKKIPALRWFTEGPEALGAVLSTKSTEWAYEEEYRVILSGLPRREALFPTIDPGLIDGVILGSRAPEALIRNAEILRAQRPAFTLEQVSSTSGTYELVASPVEDHLRKAGAFL